MKRIFYLSLFTLIILLSPCYLVTYGQVSDNALKAICKAQYEKDISSRTDYMQDWIKEGVLTFRSADELFQGCFKDTKVFLIVYENNFKVDHGPRFVPALYAINIHTRKLRTFNNKQAFYDFVNKAKKNICNLDRVYFYLYLFANVFPGKNMQDDVIDPSRYGKELCGHSEFFRQKKSQILFTWNATEYLQKIDEYGNIHSLKFLAVPDVQIDKDILHSNNDSIIIYASGLRENMSVTYRYSFTFNKQNGLSGVKLDTYSVKY